MKQYTTGSIATTVGAMALVTRLWLSEGFNISNPQIFWGAQFLFILYYVIQVARTFINWEPVGNLTKVHLVRSIIAEIGIYALGFTQGKYGALFILILGIILAYVTRDRAGLIKKKSTA